LGRRGHIQKKENTLGQNCNANAPEELIGIKKDILKQKKWEETRGKQV